MCGIAGWYRRGRGAVADSVVTAQCDTIVHRGPDDAGTFVDGDFGFGMRRLSIIDLAGGHQPMFTADGRYAIVSEASREYLWVLSRKPALTSEDDKAIRSKLQTLGFDVSALQNHPHGSR